MPPANPAETFRCDRQAMTLSRSGCARLWQSVKDRPPQPFEGRWHCRACPIGAAHAGVEAPQQETDQDAGRIAIEHLCPRCVRGGSRLIGGNLCVSCYNRAREIIRGKNRKGNPPKVVAARLSEITVLVGAPGVAHEAQATGFQAVTGAAEAMLTAAKAAQGAPLSFSRPQATLTAPVA